MLLLILLLIYLIINSLGLFYPKISYYFKNLVSLPEYIILINIT